jgi:hypothetical protein
MPFSAIANPLPIVSDPYPFHADQAPERQKMRIHADPDPGLFVTKFW